MSWKVEPYNSLVIFTPGVIYAHNQSSYFLESVDTRLFGSLTSIDFNRENTLVADNITTTVTFHNSEYENGTMVICQTFHIQEKSTSAAILYFAGSYANHWLIIFLFVLGTPYWKTLSITYQENEVYFTAVLELGDMFDGGGVPIDHYIIQVDNGTQLETAGPTYSFDIMYNTTLSVNISANNCAGYSDPFLLEIGYKPGEQKTVCVAVQYITNCMIAAVNMKGTAHGV